jgi:hypothetical protein
MVTIYQFALYDISTDHTRKSRRWGTRPAIEALGGTVLEETAVEVEESAVKSDMAGLTAIGFNPNWQSGFQQQVR